MRKLEILLVVFIAIVLLPLVVWNITFGFHVAYPLAAVFVVGLYATISTKKAKFTYLATAFGFLLYIAMLPVTLIQLTNTQQRYMGKINQGKELSIVEKSNVWGLNMMMATVSAPVYPEAAFETAWMAISDGSPLTVKNDFFLFSPRIQKAIKSGSTKTIIRWSGDDYLSATEGRASLALNQCTFRRDGADVSVGLNITYPKNGSAVVKLGFLPIYVEEGLFRYLTDRGWLKNYDITWTATLT